MRYRIVEQPYSQNGVVVFWKHPRLYSDKDVLCKNLFQFIEMCMKCQKRVANLLDCDLILIHNSLYLINKDLRIQTI